MEEQEKKTGGLFQRIVLTAMLVVVPGISWYYLSEGMKYRKNSLSELKDYGKVENFQTKDINGKYVTTDSLKGKLAIVEFVLNGSDSADLKMMGNYIKMRKQFQERKEVCYLTFVNADSTNTSGIALRNNLSGKGSFVVPITKDKMMEFMKAFKIENNQTTSYPYLVFVDLESKVRFMYDATKLEPMKRMVEHIAIKLPLIKTDDPEVLHAREK
jgi:AhpC/TSA family